MTVPRWIMLLVNHDFEALQLLSVAIFGAVSAFPFTDLRANVAGYNVVTSPGKWEAGIPGWRMDTVINSYWKRTAWCSQIGVGRSVSGEHCGRVKLLVLRIFKEDNNIGYALIRTSCQKVDLSIKWKGQTVCGLKAAPSPQHQQRWCFPHCNQVLICEPFFWLLVSIPWQPLPTINHDLTMNYLHHCCLLLLALTILTIPSQPVCSIINIT